MSAVLSLSRRQNLQVCKQRLQAKARVRLKSDTSRHPPGAFVGENGVSKKSQHLGNVQFLRAQKMLQ